MPQGPIILPGVPGAWYGGSGAYVSTPLPPGSTGWVIFADRAIGEWLEQGAPGDPLLGRTHALADGLFLPCRIGVSAPGVTSPAATVIEGPLVQIGAGAVQPAVLGTLEHTALNAYATAITAAVSTLAGLAATWAGVAGPAQVLYANGHAAFLTAVTAAQTALATALGPALSTTVTVR